MWKPTGWKICDFCVPQAPFCRTIFCVSTVWNCKRLHGASVHCDDCSMHSSCGVVGCIHAVQLRASSHVVHQGTLQAPDVSCPGHHQPCNMLNTVQLLAHMADVLIQTPKLQQQPAEDGLARFPAPSTRQPCGACSPEMVVQGREMKRDCMCKLADTPVTSLENTPVRPFLYEVKRSSSAVRGVACAEADVHEQAPPSTGTH